MQDANTDPAVIGDLIETYAAGRTRWWFWKQAVAAALPLRFSIVRWVVAIPLAYEVSRFAFRMTLHLAWTITGGPAAFDTASMRWSFILSGFVMTATFVSTGTLVVPQRKPLVAKNS